MYLFIIISFTKTNQSKKAELYFYYYYENDILGFVIIVESEIRSRSVSVRILML